MQVTELFAFIQALLSKELDMSPQTIDSAVSLLSDSVGVELTTVGALHAHSRMARRA